MTTAFQTNAFQNSAFQIDAVIGRGARRIRHSHMGAYRAQPAITVGAAPTPPIALPTPSHRPPIAIPTMPDPAPDSVMAQMMKEMKKNLDRVEAQLIDDEEEAVAMLLLMH